MESLVVEQWDLRQMSTPRRFSLSELWCELVDCLPDARHGGVDRVKNQLVVWFESSIHSQNDLREARSNLLVR